MAIITRTAALKDFFSTEAKPMTNQELIELRRADPDGFDKLAEECAKALGQELAPKQN